MNRQSPIANRQSPIANRQSPIANRQSPIANRQSPIAERRNERGRERWICVGQVRAGWYIRAGNCGFPGGLYLHWRGRIAWCQPYEFLEWHELMGAVARRLKLAGLHLAASASRRGQAPWVELWVLVKRDTNCTN